MAGNLPKIVIEIPVAAGLVPQEKMQVCAGNPDTRGLRATDSPSAARKTAMLVKGPLSTRLKSLTRPAFVRTAPGGREANAQKKKPPFPAASIHSRTRSEERRG